jgi:hypothetical protein
MNDPAVRSAKRSPVKKIRTACFMILVLLLSGCGGNAEPTNDALASFTPIPFEEVDTPEVVATDVVASLVPHGQPLSEWNGIPIMPGAIEGEGDASSYRFTTTASWVEIQAFYASQLSQLGWELLGSAEGKNGAVMLIFDGGEKTVSVSIVPNGETSIVVIVM